VVSILAISNFATKNGMISFQAAPPQGNVFPIITFSYCQGTPITAPTGIRSPGTLSTYDTAKGKIVIRGIPPSSYGYVIQNINVPDVTDIRPCKVNYQSASGDNAGQWVAATNGALSFEGCPCLALIGLGVPEFFVPK
jgi:hypothetical protein